MKVSAVKKIRTLCTGDITFVLAGETTVTCLFPYSAHEIELEIDGDTESEQVESFVNAVNQELEDMMDHLGDCKLDYPLSEGGDHDAQR